MTLRLGVALHTAFCARVQCTGHSLNRESTCHLARAGPPQPRVTATQKQSVSVGLEPAATNASQLAGSAGAVRECVARRSSSTAGLSYQQGCRSTEPSVPATGGEPVAWRRSGRSPCQHRCGATAAQLVATSRQAASRDEQPRGLRPASSSCCRRGAAERARAATRVRVPGRPEARARKRAGLLANRCSLLGAALSQI